MRPLCVQPGMQRCARCSGFCGGSQHRPLGFPTVGQGKEPCFASGWLPRAGLSHL